MRIAVNTRLLQRNGMDGIGWFTYHTLQRIVKQNKEHEFIFIFDRAYDEKFIFADNVKPVVIAPPTRHPLLIYYWLEYSLPKIFKRYQPDIFLSPDGYVSLKGNIAQLAVIHDLNFHYFPNDFGFSFRYFYNKYFPKYAQKASRIATVSEYSKQDIIQKYNIDNNKIDVVYNGTNDIYKPVNEQIKDRTKAQISEGKPYFVFVGTMIPRKNICNILKAFNIFKKENNFDHQLVLVGSKKKWTNDMEQTFQSLNGNRKDVIFKNWTAPNDLANILGAANAVVYPSKFEGFGVPIIEGMKAGVPVITANNTSMPEVAGGAALLVDSKSPEDIAANMKKIVVDKALKEKLIQKGLERANYFSWDKTADLLWESIEKTIK